MAIKSAAEWRTETLALQTTAIAGFHGLVAAMERGVPVEESLPMLLRTALDEAVSFGDEAQLFIALGEVVASRRGMTPRRYARLEEALYLGFAGEVARARRYDDPSGDPLLLEEAVPHR